MVAPGNTTANPGQPLILNIEPGSTMSIVFTTTNELTLTYTPPAAPAPGAPSSLAVVALSQSTIGLAWDLADSTDTSVVVRRAPDGVTFSDVATLPAGSTTYVDTGLSAGSPYTYEIVAMNAGGASSPSGAMWDKTWQQGYTLSIPAQDPNGWTVIPAVAHTFYVDSVAGSDTNAGTTSGAPFASAQAAVTAVSSVGLAESAAILFKRGSTWTGGLPHMSFLTGGASRTAPLIFGNYGAGARPIFDTAAYTDSCGIDLIGGSDAGGPSGTILHVWYIGLDFYASCRDPGSAHYDATHGPSLQAAGLFASINSLTDIHVEDCQFRFMMNGIVINPTTAQSVNDIRIRRCEILDSWGGGSPAPKSQGAIISGVTDLLIDGCIFDHNGWLAGQTIDIDGGATQYNHNLYLAGAGSGAPSMNNVTVMNCVFTNAACWAIHVAYVPVSNVLILGNIVADCPDGILANGNGVTVTGNVITEMGAWMAGGGLAQAWDVNLSAGSTNVTIEGNWQINSALVAYPAGNYTLLQNAGVITGTIWRNNIFRGRATSADANAAGLLNQANADSTSTFGPNTVGAAAWSNSLTAYAASISVADTAGWIVALRDEDQANWVTAQQPPAVIAYVAAGS